jgi:hypothetical protein
LGPAFYRQKPAQGLCLKSIVHLVSVLTYLWPWIKIRFLSKKFEYKMKHYLFFFALASLLTACQDDKPIAMAADLYLRFDQDSKSLKAEALFFEVDSVSKGKNLIFQNGVSLNGTKMPTVSLPGGMVRYELELPGGTVAPKYVFEFKDNSGQERALPLTINVFEKVGVEATTCQNLPCLNLSFDGPDIGQEEKLVAMFTDSTNTSQSIEIKGPIVKNQIPVAPAQLKRLKPGPATAYLVRSKMASENKDGILAKKLTEFYSSSVKVEINK